MEEQPARPTVQAEKCSECGFDGLTITATNAERTLRGLGPRYKEALALQDGEDPDILLRRRPDARTWSALECAAHMRDVIALWGWGLHQALTKEHPELPDPDPDLPDRTASESSYNSQDLLKVVEDLSANADRIARKAANIAGDAWDRAVTFGNLDMTTLAIVRKVAHEGHHHLLDIGRSINAARKTS